MSSANDDPRALNVSDIFQTLILSGDMPPALPEPVARNIRLVREAHPRARHALLSDADVRSFLAAHFGADVSAAYDRLAPFSFRSDLARYALLLVHGGLYVDIGVRFVAPLSGPPDCAILAFRDYWLSTLHASGVCGGLVLARPGRPEMKTAIEMIVAHVESGYYGATPLDPTGPPVFARALAHHNDVGSYHFGQYCPVAGETQRKNLVFLTPEGEIVALGKSGPGADLSHLGLTGTNNYIDLWRARRVYGEPTRRWRFDAPQIKSRHGRRDSQGLAYQPPDAGFVVFGPYCALPKGRHRASMRFSPDSTVQACAFDILVAHGARQVVRVAQGAAALREGALTLEFTLDQDEEGVEFRMWSDGLDRGRFLEMEIETLAP